MDIQCNFLLFSILTRLHAILWLLKFLKVGLPALILFLPFVTSYLKYIPGNLITNDDTVIMNAFCSSSPSITVYACDCSEDTLEKANEIVCSTKGVDVKDRFHPFVLDISKETFPDWLFCKSCQSSRAKAVDLLLG